MRSFHKLFLFAFILLCLALAKKKKAQTEETESNPFGSEYDVIMNPSLKEFEDEISKSNNLIFLYVFNSKLDRSK